MKLKFLIFSCISRVSIDADSIRIGGVVLGASVYQKIKPGFNTRRSRRIIKSGT